jgi:hypothetical protein
MNDDDLIDFSSVDDNQTNDQTVKYYKDNKLIQYNSSTMEFYRVLREKKMDTFMQSEDFKSECAFKFPYQWDPYTGERRELDPFGSLYFFPDDLIHLFYINRLNGLWTEPKDTANGYFQGMYGDALGAGTDINIIGRGHYPELYLFRLPIPDCYLTDDHNISFITMGPVLTRDELIEIDRLAETHYRNNYALTYGRVRPSLLTMFTQYELALNPRADPECMISSHDKAKELHYKQNMKAVDRLKLM